MNVILSNVSHMFDCCYCKMVSWKIGYNRMSGPSYRPRAYKTEMNLCLNMCILIGKRLAVFRDSCFSLQCFRLKTQKSTVLEKKMILSAILIDLKCTWLQSDLADLEKHQTFAFLLMIDF